MGVSRRGFLFLFSPYIAAGLFSRQATSYTRSHTAYVHAAVAIGSQIGVERCAFVSLFGYEIVTRSTLAVNRRNYLLAVTVAFVASTVDARMRPENDYRSYRTHFNAHSFIPQLLFRGTDFCIGNRDGGVLFNNRHSLLQNYVLFDMLLYSKIISQLWSFISMVKIAIYLTSY